jgi:DNA-binding transcriptional LysR family regulator
MVCIPIAMLEFKLLAHRDHPLQGKRDVKADEFRQYPSPALPLGMAPALIQGLQAQGLASQQCGMVDYEEASWEGFAANGLGLSYGATHQVPSMLKLYNIEPLNYELGIHDCIGLVGHRDVLTDPGFTKLYSQTIACLRSSLGGTNSGIQFTN